MFVTVRGLRVHVQRLSAGGAAPAGAAPVVVCVHGLLSENLSGYYRGLAAPISRAGADVVLYDLRGHGLSDRPPSGYRLDDLVDDFVALLDELDVDRPVHLIGNSFGGVLALRIGLARPDLVGSLTLLDAHETSEDGGSWAEAMANQSVIAQLVYAHHRPAEQYERAFGTARRKDHRLMRTIHELLLRTTLPEDLATIAPVPPAELAGLTLPVLAVYGGRSEHLPAGHYLARTLPDCTLVELPGRAHTILREGSDALRPIVLDWLSRHAGTAPAPHVPAAADVARSPAPRPLRPPGTPGTPETPRTPRTRRPRRYLFVVPPLAGHVNPAVAVAEELARRGADVTWAGPPAGLRGLLPTGARLLPTGGDGAGDPRWLTARGAAGVKFLWEGFLLPLARAMHDGVAQAVQEVRPDVVVADQHALAGAVAATAARLPWATSASTSAELGGYRALPGVGEQVRAVLRGFAAESGLPDGDADLRFSEHLVLVYSTPALIGTAPAQDRYAFVGAALRHRSAPDDFPWQRLAPDRPRVLVSVGTLNGHLAGAFHRAVAQAVGERADRVQAILAAPHGTIADPPPATVVHPHLPQQRLLPHVDAVVSHGGHNTVCEALAHGVPLVVAPIRHDGPANAERVAATGCGLRVRFARLTAAELGGCLDAVLDDPSFRAAADRIRRSFAAAGGARTAADRLEALG